jgi:prepilin-type N-terminal cleavage/methylation domain-containing protein
MKTASHNSRSAFTLIELMIVIAIMGLIVAMGVPLVYKIMHKAPMTQAVRDIVEVCSNARAKAIMTGSVAELMIHPRDGKFDVVGGGGGGGGGGPVAAANTRRGPGAPQADIPPMDGGASAAPGSGLSAQLSDRVIIELLDVNKTGELRDADWVKVRFYPNGTCDDVTIILLSDTSERAKISLEITTALANVVTDPTKIASR